MDYHLYLISSDNTIIEIDAKRSDQLNADSVFETLDKASVFFENGSVGYSPNGKSFDGLKLETYKWEVKPLEVEHIKSSFFENKNIFPEGSIKFDNAFLMENIEHEWKSLAAISYCQK